MHFTDRSAIECIRNIRDAEALLDEYEWEEQLHFDGETQYDGGFEGNFIEFHHSKDQE